MEPDSGKNTIWLLVLRIVIAMLQLHLIAMRRNESKHEIIIGSGPSMGIVSDVPPEVRNYSASGFKVVKWWLEENQNLSSKWL